MTKEIIDMPIITSSKEIATLTGKKHGNVLRDIRHLLANLGGSPLLDYPLQGFTKPMYKIYKDKRGYTVKYLLNQRLTLNLLMSYSFRLRFDVVSYLTRGNPTLADNIINFARRN